MEVIAYNMVKAISYNVVGDIFVYVSNFKRNVQNVEDKVAELLSMEGVVDQEVLAANREAKVIGLYISWWKGEVTKIKDKSDQFFKGANKVQGGCLNGCLNVQQRFLLSRKAARLIVQIDRILDRGRKHIRLEHSTVPAGMLPARSTTDSEELESKMKSMEQVVAALQNDMAIMLSKQARCRPFSYDEMQEATNKFDESNIIGKGGEGMVYKGTIVTDNRNKIPVAVKCLKFKYSKEFRKEIDMLSALHHANLVSLVGYCQQHDSNILVYELMVNKSLHDYIHNKDGCSLTWEQRLKILIGAARGLDYLHTGSSNEFKIIHRDVKPANILLDENMAPKISDFGLSRKGPANQTHSAVTTAAKGTVGYYAPECFTTGQITTMVDVWAFGVVLYEVLCRKQPWERLRDDSNTEDQSTRQWAYENIDKFLTGAISISCFEVFIDIADKCLTKDPSERPSMCEVVSRLDYALKLQKRDSGAGGSAMLQNYRNISEPGVGVTGRSNSSKFEKSSKQKGSGSSKATISDHFLQQSDLWTTKKGKSERASTERASGSSQSTKYDIGSNEPSTSRNTSNRMTPKVETRPYKSLPRSQDRKIQEDVASSGKSNWAYTTR